MEFKRTEKRLWNFIFIFLELAMIRIPNLLITDSRRKCWNHDIEESTRTLPQGPASVITGRDTFLELILTGAGTVTVGFFLHSSTLDH